jgi:hypothetical protein
MRKSKIPGPGTAARRSGALVGAVLVLLAVAGAQPTVAQQPAVANNVYLELLGNGGLYSINYERRLTEQLGLRAGIARWTADDWWSDAQTTITSLPLGVSFLPGSGTRRIELGAGILVGQRQRTGALGSAGQTNGFTSLTGVVGYRFQPARSGWLFRVGFTPFYGLGDEDAAYPDQGFLPSIGVSAGYSF